MSYMLRNCSNRRAIYHLHGLIAICPAYFKTRSMVGSDYLLLRFLDCDTSRLLAIYVGIIRPHYNHLCEMLWESERDLATGGPEPQKPDCDHLFVKLGQPYTTKTIYGAFERLFSRWLGVKIGVSAYRQVAAYLVNNLVVSRGLDVARALPFVQQAGHSIFTASEKGWYGRSTEDFSHLTADKIELYHMASYYWHGLLGLASVPPRPVIEAAKMGSTACS